MTPDIIKQAMAPAAIDDAAKREAEIREATKRKAEQLRKAHDLQLARFANSIRRQTRPDMSIPVVDLVVIVVYLVGVTAVGLLSVRRLKLTGEVYFLADAIRLGASPLEQGLVISLPLFVGSAGPVFALRLLRFLKRRRLFVVAAACGQALTLLALSIGEIRHLLEPV